MGFVRLLTRKQEVTLLYLEPGIALTVSCGSWVKNEFYAIAHSETGYAFVSTRYAISTHPD